MAPTTCTRRILPTPADPYLDRLAHLVAAHGIEAFESDIARLVVRLRAAGHCDPVVDLLADHSAPAVVRERALGLALGLLTRPAPSTTSSSAAA
jgi:hypothetical protein